MKKLLVVVMLTSMVLFSVGCGKNNVDTEQNTTVEDSGNKDTSETIDSEKNNQKQDEEKSNISEEKQEMKTLKIYYVNENAEIVSEEMKTENIDDTTVWNQLIEKGILTEGCKLNSCKIDENNKTIDLDMNTEVGERIRSMGTTGKDEILTCIVNSYLDTYNCEKLKLTENGQALDTGDTELDGYMNHF